MQETEVQSMCWEDPLEEEMATHSNILAWRIPWTEEPGGLQSMGLQTVGHNWASEHTHTHTHTYTHMKEREESHIPLSRRRALLPERRGWVANIRGLCVVESQE